MKSVASAFVKAQRIFAPLIKNATNPHLKSKYADLASCVEAVIDALNINGIALVQKTHSDDHAIVVETLFVHESGEVLSGGLLRVPAPKQDPQGYGSALTYARRYSLMASCGIAGEDDDGIAARKTDSSPSEPIKPEILKELEARLRSSKDMADLQLNWSWLQKGEQEMLKSVKDEMKAKLSALKG